uniref:Metalloendopeptidase n=3 Tax=Clytia hemisphaerica TaxID=252671 RepID=A0A7M5XK55_9CNID
CIKAEVEKSIMKLGTLLLATCLAFASGAWVPEMENAGLYEGDMILDPDQQKEVEDGTFTFSSTGNRNKLWPNAVVPYSLTSDLARDGKFMREFQHSIDQYHKYTCIRFKRRSNERAYIGFYMGGGCSSPVGYTGGRNRVSLSKGCHWRSTIMHEIGHSLGFHHEQSRPDRDNHVTILFHNVARGTEHNFKKQSYSTTDSKGTPYDYRSMIHYSWDAHSVPAK